jgi:energy-coupling factor transporter transmembrane protein EcfT
VATDSLNVGLVRLHRTFFVLALAASIAIPFTSNNPRIFILAALLLALAAAHWYAAKGSRLGRPYGRRVSRVIGFMWLLGFPIGTILAIYVFVNTGKRRWKSCMRLPPSRQPAHSTPGAV